MMSRKLWATLAGTIVSASLLIVFGGKLISIGYVNCGNVRLVRALSSDNLSIVELAHPSAQANGLDLGSYAQALAWNPSSPQALYGLGVVCALEGDYEHAQEYLIRAAQLSPGHLIKFLVLGNVYDSSQRRNKAIHAWRAAGAARFFLQLGDAYREQGRWNEDREAYQKVVEISPGEFMGYYWLGLTYYGEMAGGS